MSGDVGLEFWMLIFARGRPAVEPEPVVSVKPPTNEYWAQSGVGVTVGVLVTVAVRVGVELAVPVGLGVPDGSGVTDGIGVLLAVEVGGAGVSLGCSPSPGWTIEREVRKVSTIPSRYETRWIIGHTWLRKGVRRG
jgi:hypothetical protein